MKPNLRLVKSPEEELAFFNQKEKEANILLNILITQALCFKKLKEFSLMNQFYHNFKKDRDVVTYLESLEKFRYLFELGKPSDSDIKIVKIAMAQIKLLGDTSFNSADQLDLSKTLSKLLFRAALFKMTKELQELSNIASHFRAYQSTTIVRADIQKYSHMFSIQD
jgi:hypothetical protein